MDQQQLFVKMTMNAWEIQISRLDKFFKSLTDEQFKQEIAPGKNTIFYLFGHLIAVNDNILKVIGAGERLYPQLDEAFIQKPDKSGLPTPSVSELKSYWETVNKKLTEAFARIKPAEWFEKHTVVSAEDFAKEPHRNKLSVIINRTNHNSYHHGQLILTQKKDNG